MDLSIKAREVKNEYAREYRKKNRDRLKEYYKEYRAGHKEEVKEYNRRYWERKVAQAE